MQDYFNNNLQDAFEAGPEMVVDESTSGWKGVDEKSPDGPPSMVHQKGKPQNVSFMLKTMADCETGIILKIELQEGKEEMLKKQFSDKWKSSTAVVR